jgi:hypothetical protein
VFRKRLIRVDMQQNLILPARTETFEQLVITARTYFQSTMSMSSSSSTSQRVFYSGADSQFCPHCFADSGRELAHTLADCRKYAKLVFPGGQSNKRSHEDFFGCFSSRLLSLWPEGSLLYDLSKSPCSECTWQERPSSTWRERKMSFRTRF